MIVVDDGSSDDTGQRARRPGRVVIRHPYNKGNGAAVKTGIRRATGEFVLIVDADGQHQPEDAPRLVAALGEYDLVVGARSPTTQATAGRRVGNALLNWLASYLTGRPIPDLTSGFRGARRDCLRDSFTCCRTVLDADDDDAGLHQGGLQRHLRADRGAAADRALEDPLRPRRREVLPDPAEGHHALQPAARLRADQRGGARRRDGYGVVNLALTGKIPNGAVLLILFAVIVFLVGLVSEQIASLRFEGPRPSDD